MKKLKILAAIPAAMLSVPALAQTDTDTLDVSATVRAVCTISSTTEIPFGSVAPSTTDIDNGGSVDLICTGTTPWFVSIIGFAASVSAERRQNRMRNPTESRFLNYDIYSDAGRTTPFPTVAGTSGAGDTGGIGTGTTQTVIVYARIPHDQKLPPPGTYRDTLTITITY